MNEDIRKKITRARSQLILHKPFFGYLSTYLEPLEDEGCPTMGTDGVHLFYNPDFVDSLDMETLQAVLAHEVFHPAFGHIWRRGARDPIRFNLAADSVDNAWLLAEGFKLPPGAILSGASHEEIEEVKKLSAEEVYEKLKVPPPPRGGKGGAGKGKAGGDGGADKGKGATISTPGGDVSADGKQFDDHSVWDKKKDGEDWLEKTKKMEQEWREQVSRARQIVKSQGKGMGNVDELVDELLEPRMNWKEFLRNFILSSVITDYQICPPSKRHLWRGIHLPSPKKSDAIEVAFIVDTSGSMSTDEIRDGLSELKGILQQFESFRIWYVECDWDIQRIIELTPYTYNLDEVKKIKGRVGTRFPVAHIVEQIQNEKGGEPSAIVYFTDGYGNVEGSMVNLPVIWLLCQKHDFKPGFGAVVEYTRR